MSQSTLNNCRIAGISTCVPDKIFDNIKDTTQFPQTDVKKIVSLAGIAKRRVAGGNICSSDLCYESAVDLIDKLGWERDSIDGLIFVTQTPDHFLPSTSCILHKRLELSENCAAFDIGLGCSGYPYGLWMASMMINSGHHRVLLLHGETPSRFTQENDRSTFLLFGDAGSATAVEKDDNASNPWCFSLHTDGSGYEDLLIKAGGFRNPASDDPDDFCLTMNGTNLFNFTIKRTPSLIQEILTLSGSNSSDIDYFIFHQSNRYIIKHLMKKCGLKEEQVPLILNEFGNTGGPSVPLTITLSVDQGKTPSPQSLVLLGYGVGLSWGAAKIQLDRDVVLSHSELAVDT
jgi:3-oxoacyl-[acyl-carrier-protein] synthase-3